MPEWLYRDRALSESEVAANYIPEPAGLPGDVNNDGAINNLDITSFIAALAAEDEAAFLAAVPGGSYSNADLDGSGVPNNLDITPFISALTAGANAAAVPEPATLALLGRRRHVWGECHRN